MDIVTRIEIDAPKEQAWRVLQDVSSWDRWNPAMKKLSVEAFEPGGKVRFTIKLGPGPLGGAAVDCDMAWVRPGEGFAWRGPSNKLLKRLVEGEHYFLIEGRGDRCIFHHGERFTGPLSGVLEAVAHEKMEAMYSSVNRAFKATVEAG